MKSASSPGDSSARPIELFLCGDLMLGRGVDQILPQPSHPALFEACARDARDYVALAEAANGPLPRRVACDYIWGDALEELARRAPDLRLANLETSITCSDAHWPGKDIHYRMQPGHTRCLSAAGLDCCALANNHVLDWGYSGLSDTLASLRSAGIAAAGAGENLGEAQRPAVLEVPGGGRVRVLACGAGSSGIPAAWAATADRAGVYRLDELSPREAERVARQVGTDRRPGDLAVVSIHWGGNWGYRVSPAERRFAHALIDQGVDLVHGHSSHHPRPIEVYREHLILYGCGDFLNDYEGIGGYESYRGDLTLMYFAAVRAADGHLLALTLCPMRIRRFRASRAAPPDVAWIGEVLSREGRPLGTRTVAAADGSLGLEW